MNDQPSNGRLAIYLRLIVVISALALLFLSLPINPALLAVSAPVATSTLAPVATISLTPIATQPAAYFPLNAVTPVETATLQPTLSVSNPDTLRFVFPTQGPLPISLWRPPPYDRPWAPGPHDHFYFARPIATNEVNWPSADYRYGGTVDTDQHIIHTGIDIGAPFGTPVLAAGDGTVVWAGFGLEGMSPNPKDPYGMAVLIRHDFGFQGHRLDTVYGHMSEIDVVAGEKVKAGTRIGLVGQTGQATGPHLHF
jgi:murein DD-endopeptidase MepM/ murein hydrolase activator NlpD